MTTRLSSRRILSDWKFKNLLIKAPAFQ
uniref:Uncharacterized protein n=1 Tax=Anguilla anguilla TaxID=7936 RepID=A0A0E9W8S2_ANGAN